jgi:uncharacterized protein DUF262/uncharacterized protein DUF1524
LRSVSDLFKAEASNLHDTMTSHSGNAGFKIPDYQRAYDWSEEKVRRLLEDCLNGFYYLSNNSAETPFTFLGTIILVKERSPEATFDGSSLLVVDGQQRLTTLSLLSCALIEMLIEKYSDLTPVTGDRKTWLISELEFQREVLYQCVIGQLQGRGSMHPFPRIIREDDGRARGARDSEYRSQISKFLMNFSKFYTEDQEKFDLQFLRSNVEGGRIVHNYQYLRNELENFLYSGGGEESDLECEPLHHSDFKKASVRQLFDKDKIIGDESARERMIAELARDIDSAGIFRCILFASYLTKAVVLTRVETEDENAAFDIFDALNTTGEPLTALETLKPKVIQYENSHSGYRGSESEANFDRIESYLDKVYVDPEIKQRETKEILVSSALYLNGYKLPFDLSSQRNYLRSSFDSIPFKSGSELRRRFIASIADVAEYRYKYWKKEQIGLLKNIHSNGQTDVLMLCVAFISDMNTSLSIPIIARYWSQYNGNNDEIEFVNVVKALTAFIVLRRSVTGNTGGIDSDLRGLMQRPPTFGGDPLCAGLENGNELLSASELKAELRNLLKKNKKVDIQCRKDWISKAQYVPLGAHSKPLCRFLLLAASHQSRPVEGGVGILSKQYTRKSDELDFLSYRYWTADKYSTVEHVAPNSVPSAGWDAEIYRQPYTKNTIGNLVLLPQRENSSVGNASWRKKGFFIPRSLQKPMMSLVTLLRELRKRECPLVRRPKNYLKKVTAFIYWITLRVFELGIRKL